MHRPLFGKHLQKDGQRLLDGVVSRLSKPRLNAGVKLERLRPNPIDDLVAGIRDVKALAPAIVLIVRAAYEVLSFEFQCGTACVSGIEACQSRKLSKMAIAKSRKIQKSAPFLNAQSLFMEGFGPKHCAQSPNGAVHIDVDERAEVYVTSWLFHDFECNFEDRAFAKGMSDRIDLARKIVAVATKNCSICYIFLDRNMNLTHAWAMAATRPNNRR